MSDAGCISAMPAVRRAGPGLDCRNQEPKGPSMRILLIEDESPAASRLNRLLGRTLVDLGEDGKAPAEVAWVGDPDLALAEAAKEPELIFLDLNLDGFQTFDWLRGSRLPAAKTLIVSADVRFCEEAQELGVFGYLFKPVDENLLRSHLERFLRARDPIPGKGMPPPRTIDRPEVHFGDAGRTGGPA